MKEKITELLTESPMTWRELVLALDDIEELNFSIAEMLKDGEIDFNIANGVYYLAY